MFDQEKSRDITLPYKLLIQIKQLSSQPAFTCPKLTIETLEEGVKYVQS